MRQTGSKRAWDDTSEGAYGQRIDALRCKDQEWISKCCVPRCAWGQSYGQRPGALLRFVGKKGERAMVLVNMSSSEAIAANMELPYAGSLMPATPEKSATQSTNGTVNVPARPAAVVMEQ